ncbi:MAG: hypothetical protein ABIH26_16080 [Candidatus Eisenbacteria bacterium]
MGGWGSTRWDGYVKRLCVEDCRRLSASRLAKAPEFGTVVRWNDGAAVEIATRTDAAELRYSVNGEPVREALGLRPKRTTFGKVGCWVVCPRCGRRRAALYLPPSGGRFACRSCWGLTYRSRQTWDKRVSAFRRDPAAFVRAVKSGDLRAVLLALRVLSV